MPEKIKKQFSEFLSVEEKTRTGLFSKEKIKFLDMEKFLQWVGEIPETEYPALILEKLPAEQKAEIIWSLFAKARDIFLLTSRPPREKNKTKISLAQRREEFLKNVFENTENGKKQRIDKINKDSDLLKLLQIIRILWNDAQTRNIFKREYSRHLLEESEINGDYEQYRILENQIKDLESRYNELTAKFFSQRNEDVDEFSVLVYGDIKEDLKIKRAESSVIIENNPELAALVEYEKLKKYKDQLDKGGFIWTKSRKDILEDIKRKLLTSRPIKIISESGAGKTTLINAAAKELTGSSAARTTGTKTERVERLFAFQSSDAQGAFFRYGVIMEGLTGKKSERDVKSRHNGLIVLDDEFNMRPSDVQMGIVKSLSLGIKPGEYFSPPNVLIKEKIQPCAAYIAAGNPNSEKYIREEADMAVDREFVGNVIMLDYFEQIKKNPELYQIMFASLLDGNYRLKVAKEEVAPTFVLDKASGKGMLDEFPKSGGFLWRFANAWREICNSVSWKENVLTKAHPSQLKEEFYIQRFILDTGAVLGWLKDFKLEKNVGLEVYLKDRLKKYVENYTASDEDKKIVRQILEYFGIELDEKSAPVYKFKILTPRDIGFLNPNVPRPLRKKEDLKPENIIYTFSDGTERVYTEILPTSLIDKDIKIGQKISIKNKDYIVRGVWVDNGEMFLEQI